MRWEGDARAKSAASLQPTPADAAEKHQLQVLQVDVSLRRPLVAPGQSASQGQAQQEGAKK